MKFHETHFEEYLQESNRANLHPSLEKMYQRKFPKHVTELPNLIFYGPAGVGKYTQMLRAIRKYSPSELKYEKKIIITQPKENYFIKISDIHYEIDMSLLGCNPKNVWHEIYLHVIDIVSSTASLNNQNNTNNNKLGGGGGGGGEGGGGGSVINCKTGIMVCKNFHDIHSELLEIFYSYMQKNVLYHSVELKFILVTDEISFLPENILQCCFLVRVPRPSKTLYKKCFSEKIAAAEMILPPVDTITNNKYLFSPGCEVLMQRHEKTCDKIISVFDNAPTLEIPLLILRENLYEIFIGGLDIFHCVWYILTTLANKNLFHERHLSLVLIHTFKFFQYFNNNYRPICHLELFLLQCAKVLKT